MAMDTNLLTNGYCRTKPVLRIARPAYLNILDTDCVHCHNELSIPHIVCVVCNVNICTMCFSTGAEFSNHLNSHSYIISNDNFSLFTDSNWTAKEELKLLDTLLEYGNFDIVVEKLSNRTLKEVKEHYEYYYLEKFGSYLFPSFPKIAKPQLLPLLNPYRFQLSDSDEPPRHNSNSVGFHAMAGYNAARSEFELEYDSNAEDLISNLKYEAPNPQNTLYKLISELQCSIVSTYNRKLLERHRRKVVIRNHGLILTRKMMVWLHRFDMTISRRVYDRICRFIQFYTGPQFEYLLEGLHRAGELKTEISRLCEFRKKGIKTVRGGELYLELKQTHEHSMADVKTFQSSTQFNWKVKYSLPTPALSTTGKKRGVFSPLDVVGLPGFEKLTDKEQDLCKNVRLVPLSYMEFRDILINESRKTGYLKLQTARRLLKIDVNKTRRLYDFLAEEGYIQKQ